VLDLVREGDAMRIPTKALSSELVGAVSVGALKGLNGMVGVILVVSLLDYQFVSP